MKIRITYSEAEKPLFERIRAVLARDVPGNRVHESAAPGGRRIWYLSSRKEERSASR